MNTIHNRSNPAQIIGNQLGSTGLYVLIFREQGFNLVDAVLEMVSLLCVLLHSLSQRTTALALGESQNSLLVGMGQNTIHGLGLSFLIECVVSHNFFLLVIIVLFFITVIRGLVVFFCRANYSIYGFLLFLGEGFPNISDSLTFIGNRLLLIVDIAIRVLNFVTLQGHTDNEHSYLFLFLRKTINDFFNGFRRRFLRFLFRFFFRIFFLSLLILMNKFTIGDINRLIKVDNGLFISAVLMSNYRVNERTRICSGINQAQFPNNAMDNIRSVLLQLISIDGHRTNVTMLNKLLSINAILCLIKDAVGINAVTSIF